jgi:hypothetical protein
VVVAPQPDTLKATTSISDDEIFSRFKQITESKGLNRRGAVGAIARETGVPSKAVYDAIERAKKSRASA